jgi:class 3 adenylate cyclase/CHASE2 domain-containing sensor protein
MADDSKKREQIIQLALGPAVGFLVFLFSLTLLYERAELVTYDWRFGVRHSLFGPPPMSPHLGTIDIDLESVDAEGRYQDWTRDKYTDVVRLLADYGARLVGFDVFFIEPSTNLVSEAQIRALGRIDSASVNALLARSDYDEMFRRAIADAGNVYLAQTVVVPDSQRAVEPRDDDKEAAFVDIRARSPKLRVDPAASTLARGVDFDPPLRSLREAARGYAYAQTVTDVDGARRRYPVVYQYEDVVFPSMALTMACDLLGVEVTDVEVLPGEHVSLPGARMPDGRVLDLRIPIDYDGNMNVNWAGRWQDTYNHYPHMTLRRARARQERQALLDEMKRLVAENPAMANPRNLLGALNRAGHTDRDALLSVLRTFLQADGIGKALTATPGITGQSFWKSKGVDIPSENQELLFEQVRRTRDVADRLVADPALTDADLQAALPGDDPVLVAQSAAFVRSVLTTDSLTTRAVPASARPLYFYPYERYQPRRGLSASVTPDDVRDKVLFYGLTAPGTTDLSVTPVEGNYPMVGIYPNVLNTILTGQFIRRMPPWTDALLIMALGLLLSLTIPGLRVLTGAALVAGIVGLYGLVALFAFTHAGLWLEIVAPLMTLIVGYLALTIYGYVIKEKEKEFVQGAFGHYLSPAVVNEIMTNPGMVDQLGGEERVMTAYFSDLASFSTISECLTPEELVNFINDYLTEMCAIVEDYGGTIDKFEGDAILAFYGAPVYYDDHAVRGCLACVDQQRRMVEMRARWDRDRSLPPALQQLRERWQQQGRPFAHVRMGLTAGPMVVGNMGSRTRTDYTMMGDTVNLAARFESGQKIYGTGIMANEAIYEAVKDMVETRRLDLIQVVGKEEPVTAYEILDRKGDVPQKTMDVLDLYREGLEFYDRFDFAGAKTRFERALEIDPTDGPSALYADRCEDYAENPPEDLVFRAQSK